MKKRKIPMRKCVVTNEMKPKKDMIRIVKDKEDNVSIDATGKMNGRGAYISLDPSIMGQAREERALDKSLKVKLTDEFYAELEEFLNYQYARKEID